MFQISCDYVSSVSGPNNKSHVAGLLLELVSLLVYVTLRVLRHWESTTLPLLYAQVRGVSMDIIAQVAKQAQPDALKPVLPPLVQVSRRTAAKEGPHCSAMVQVRSVLCTDVVLLVVPVQQALEPKIAISYITSCALHVQALLEGLSSFEDSRYWFHSFSACTAACL
jgi:hypothetical protein